MSVSTTTANGPLRRYPSLVVREAPESGTRDASRAAFHEMRYPSGFVLNRQDGIDLM
ncbi:MAG: hypothetical protein KF751_06875 [Nitrospira sp.]|nr:hypothetical protein [Nitrospira sp.]MBX3347752.1 hypothetical protein [Nitrospira sp.]